MEGRAAFNADHLLGSRPEEIDRFDLSYADSATNTENSGIYHIPIANTPFVLEAEINTGLIHEGRVEAFIMLGALTILLFCFIVLLLYATQFRHAKRLIGQLEESNHEKTVFVRDSLHRIENSFAGIEGLLTLKSRAAGHPEVEAALQEAVITTSNNRPLYVKLLSARDSEDVCAASYLTELTESVIDVFGANARIHLETDIEDITLGRTQAFPVGVILTELLTNAVKYAYRDGSSGAVTVSLKRGKDDSAILTVSDNGVGLKDLVDAEKSESFGLLVIRALSQQMDGGNAV